MREMRLLGRCLLLWLAVLSTGAQALQVLDDRGVAVLFPAPPQRVVSLLPSVTESVCELGACERLVAVDNYSNWPAQIARLPHIGGVDDANIERIIGLKPDLVLLASSSRALQRLEALGVKVFALDMKTLEDVHRTLLKLGQVLGVPGAQALWGRVQASIDAAAHTLGPQARGTRVYFEVSSGPYAASEISHIGELMTRMGLVNIVPGSLGSVPKLNPEFVVRADPQVIMIADNNARALRDRPGWQRITAIREGRVCALDAQRSDVVTRPGPRLGEAARAMAQCLRVPLRGGAP